MHSIFSGDKFVDEEYRKECVAAYTEISAGNCSWLLAAGCWLRRNSCCRHEPSPHFFSLNHYDLIRHAGAVGKNKVELNKTNILRYAYRYYTKHFSPVYVTLCYVLVAMLQTGIFIPSTKIGLGGQLDRTQMEATWRAYLRPKKVNKRLVKQIFFPDRCTTREQQSGWFHKDTYDDGPPLGDLDGYDREGAAD